MRVGRDFLYLHTVRSYNSAAQFITPDCCFNFKLRFSFLHSLRITIQNARQMGLVWPRKMAVICHKFFDSATKLLSVGYRSRGLVLPLGSGSLLSAAYKLAGDMEGNVGKHRDDVKKEYSFSNNYLLRNWLFPFHHSTH